MAHQVFDAHLVASNASTKAIGWLLFIVIIGSLLPFVAMFVARIARRQPHGLYDLLDNGDMLITSFLSVGPPSMLAVYWQRRHVSVSLASPCCGLLPYGLEASFRKEPWRGARYSCSAPPP
jgi:hypothetical protein